jgi:regulator of sigma E protease
LRLMGKALPSWSDIKKNIQDSAGIPLRITVDRGGNLVGMTLVPEEAVEKNIFGEDVRSALIGIVASGKIERVDWVFSPPCGKLSSRPG